MIVSSGAKQSIMTLLYAILEPKDEVVYPAPYWVSYPEMVKLAGGVPVAVVPEDGSFQPSVPDIADKVGSYTKAIILNSPNNPSGVMYSADFVAEMVAFCEKKNLWLVMDDLYNRLVFDGQKAPNPYDFAKDDRRGLEARRRPGRLEDVRHDRLPDRLGARQPRGGRGDDQHPVAPDLGPGHRVAVGGDRRALGRADARSSRCASPSRTSAT